MDRKFEPFADGSSSLGIGDLTIEDAGDSVAIYGSLTVEATKQGLDLARQIAEIANQMVEKLNAMDLPDSLPKGDVTQIANPFEN